MNNNAFFSDLIRYITCHITSEVFHEPVIASDGHTYEKEALLNVFKNCDVSPITNQRFVDHTYIINHLTINLVALALNSGLIQQNHIYGNKPNIIYINGKKYDITVDIEIHGKDEALIKKMIDELESKNKLEHRYSHICPKLIHFICRYSTPKMIKYIIDKNVDLECKNYHGATPIHILCRHSTPDMIRYVIDKNVDLKCKTLDGSDINTMLSLNNLITENIKYDIISKINYKLLYDKTSNDHNYLNFKSTLLQYG